MGLRKFVVGNWKMNGLMANLGEATQIASAAKQYAGVDTALCPPATLISATASAAPGFSVGGQDCHTGTSGAFTGSISAAQLKDAGASLTIVGHSERREGLGETDELVKAKAEAAMSAGINVILCVGEPKNVRDDAEAEVFVVAQLEGSLPELTNGQSLAIAYEPIWAIGTGVVPTVDDVRAMHAIIRTKLVERYGADTGNAMRILYGGSVTGDNADELLAVENVDGALVGGASLTAQKFVPIIEAAAAL